MLVRSIIAGIFIFSGCFFVLVSSLGIIRFPDFYSRLHPAGKSDTMGQTLIILGLVIFEGFTLVSAKLLIIMAFFYLANPTATHFISKAAYKSGVEIWRKPGVQYQPPSAIHKEVVSSGD